ncbi:murein transglycosylase A [Mangrovibrevibacter kandeliae]|uniref:murein transglycosylase A n=1 Tax=Mangrovibrevibacter kandeliae TaxID=2968473 RepID=UPI002119A941|nr:murein transglycosylase A [Aurantimonas sp. CSK15Z-1]MCQ8782328.1 murein transglycosylase A [Aurantimonas sp. CSK15Z-1]
MLSPLFTPRSFADLTGWASGDHKAAFDAFRRSAPAFARGMAKTGSLGVDAAAFAAAAGAALRTDRVLAPDARVFFEHFFTPAFILPRPGSHDRGFVTGYYEPEVEASLHPTDRFRYPLYRPPADLVKVSDDDRPPGLDASFRFARRLPDGRLSPYPDRAAIEAGYLQGKGLEIAWLEDPVDAFFIHIQGSARLHLIDGGHMRVGYAAKTGHPFTAIGRVLVDAGELTLAEADMAGIRGWLDAHPERMRDLLNRNRSFIFFREAPADDPALGPVGAAKVPLTPLASIAVDRLLHTFGTPVFLSAPDLAIDGAPFHRLMVAQDTGSAILGAARADLFVGSGTRAGAVAGTIRHAADFYALLPRDLAWPTP